MRAPFTPVPVARVDDFTQTTSSFAGFGQATWEFLPDTRLTLGARYTTEDRTLVGTETLTILLPIPQRPPVTINSKISAKKPTFRAAIDHRFGPTLLAYASFNTGFKSGGYALFSPTNPPTSRKPAAPMKPGSRANCSTVNYDSNLPVSMTTIRTSR